METWVPMFGYSGLYEISGSGVVRSLDRESNHRFGRQIRKGKILKQTKNAGGYFVIGLCSNEGKKKTFLVHRLVALSFLKNPDNLPEVDHKDNDKENNEVDNLQWISQEDHAEKTRAKTYKFICPKGNKISIYNLSKFCRKNGLNNSSMLGVVSGRRKSNKGYRLDEHS